MNENTGKVNAPLNRSMMKTMKINIVQPERASLAPVAYDLSKPVAVIETEDITVFVNIEKTRDENKKEFRHFRIAIQGSSEKAKRTTNYHKAIGIALCYATQ